MGAFSLVQSIMLVIAIFSIFLVSGVSSIPRVHTDTTIPAPAPGSCPDGWIEAIEGCFLFHHTASGLSWRQGQEECERLGGYLAEIKSQDQQDFLKSLAMLEETLMSPTSWMIGLSDQGHERRWIWQHSLSDVDYESWADGHSDNSDDDCAVMDWDNDYDWVAVRCDTGGDGGGEGSPLCMRDVYDSSSSSNPPTSTPDQDTTSSTTQPQIKLVGGDNDRNGNVFAKNREGYFGPICDDTWGPVEANVACHQLGFIHGGVATTESHFGDVDVDFAMDQIICSGFEDELQECDYDIVNDCVGHEAAGVFCHDY